MVALNRLVPGLVTLLGLLFFLSHPVFAADDANTMQVTLTLPPGVFSNSTSIDPQVLSATLDNLSQNVNDASFRQLLGQFENQTKAGDYTSAKDTLSQLKDYANSPAGSSLSSTLKDLLENLSVGPNGVSVTSLDPKALSAALDGLSRNVTDPNFKQLLNQFENQANTGDYADAQNTLSKLKDFVGSPEGKNLPSTLKDLVQNLNVGPGGLSVDWKNLSNVLGVGSENNVGVPKGLLGMNPADAGVDLKTIAGLSQGLDPSLAGDLLNDSTWIGQNLGGDQGLHGIPGLTIPDVKAPPIGPLGGQSPIPSVQAPGLSSGFAVGRLEPSSLVIPGAILATVIGLVLFAKMRPGIFGRQKVPGSKVPLADDSLTGLDRGNPKQTIIYYFRKAVRIMTGRGVPRFMHETHREFSCKCTGKPEREHIGRISSLYEKAMFSGREVTASEAGEAADHFSLIEKPTSKPR